MGIVRMVTAAPCASVDLDILTVREPLLSILLRNHTLPQFEGVGYCAYDVL